MTEYDSSSDDGESVASGDWNLEFLYAIFDQDALQPWFDRDEDDLLVPGISARQPVQFEYIPKQTSSDSPPTCPLTDATHMTRS